jgi:hypothetical protein
MQRLGNAQRLGSEDVEYELRLIDQLIEDGSLSEEEATYLRDMAY